MILIDVLRFSYSNIARVVRSTISHCHVSSFIFFSLFFCETNVEFVFYSRVEFCYLFSVIICYLCITVLYAVSVHIVLLYYAAIYVTLPTCLLIGELHVTIVIIRTKWHLHKFFQMGQILFSSLQFFQFLLLW